MINKLELEFVDEEDNLSPQIISRFAVITSVIVKNQLILSVYIQKSGFTQRTYINRKQAIQLRNFINDWLDND